MIDKKLWEDLMNAVAEIIDVSYTLQCLNEVAYNQTGYLANITLSVTQLTVRVIDNATDTINDVIDAIKVTDTTNESTTINNVIKWNNPEGDDPCKK